MSEKEEKISALAKQIIELSRNSLVVNLRFLDRAISMLKIEYCYETDSIATDSVKFLCNPRYVISRYAEDRNYPVRDYLHSVMHCVFRHMYVFDCDTVLWSLACDIAVESLILEIDISSLSLQSDSVKASEISKIKKDVKLVTAEKIYAYFRNNPVNSKRIDDLIDLFSVDEHNLWYAQSEPHQ